MKSNGENYIQRLKDRKEDALDYIVDNYLPLVKGTVSKVLSPFRDDGLIEECVNDVFLSIWNNAMKFRGDVTDFKKWVYVLSKFKAIDCYRVNIKNIETVLDDIEITNENSPEDNFITMENKSEVLKLIHSLKDIDRNIFILKFLLGYKSEDIAKKFNITKASVDNRIYRGKRKLREKASNLEVI